MAVVINGTSGITGNTGTLISASTIGVGGATPSVSGAGITFPATQSASSDANTLDDYEEGTWTPTISFGGASTGITYAYQAARYIKIGRQVTVFAYVALTSKGSATGASLLNGLPFVTSAATNLYSGGATRWNVMVAGTMAGGATQFNSNPNATTVVFEYLPTGGSSVSLANTFFNNNSDLCFSYSYLTDN
jgi:hypothetical protein